MRRTYVYVLWTAILAAMLGAAPAAASTSFDFLFSMSHVNDDNQYFLNLAVSNYGYSRAALEPVLPRLAYVETDLPVVLFVADHSRRSPDYIVGLRAQGLSWSVVFDRCGVPPETLFVGIDHDPGPPYGKAWGHWRRHPRSVRLSDRDIVGLVNVQVGHRIAAVSTYELAHGSGSGRPVSVAVADHQGRRYRDDRRDDHGRDGDRHRDSGGDHGHDKGQGHGDPHGHDQGNGHGDQHGHDQGHGHGDDHDGGN
jgi:hypothetical protein